MSIVLKKLDLQAQYCVAVSPPSTQFTHDLKLWPLYASLKATLVIQRGINAIVKSESLLERYLKIIF